MTQKELLSSLSARLGWEETNVNSALEAFMDIIRQELIAGNRVDISEFGLFQALRHPEYILIEADTGERYLMPPSVEVVFEAAITTSDTETPEVGSALHFIPDALFEEEANNPFALFEPTLVNEGVHFPGLTEVVIDELKIAEEGGETETEGPVTPDTSEVPETPETPEPPVTSEAPELSETPGPSIISDAQQVPATSVTPDTLEVPDMAEVNEVCKPGVPSDQQKRSSIWIPVLGGAVVALVAFLFSRQR